ncbi:MAG: Endonuclease 4 [Chlamydiae bacterium]|nr:Endonuclease 4 [Chlamydiota bacterium]
MSKTPPEKLLIGAHTSAAGGAYNALLHGQEIGATTIQLFTSNQKQWKGRPITDEMATLWKETLKETGIKKVMSHDSYLINLGSPNSETLKKSHEAFRHEIERCHQLDITYLNFHPGAATTSTEEECLEQIIASLKKFEKLCAQGKTRLLLETTAGQGTTVGHDFSHLGYIISETKNIIPIGVCIDTCHIFAAGYDIRTKKAWDHTLEEFQKQVGFKNLYAFHVNDSMKPLASRRDRHANLGEGEIGLEAFRYMMKHPKLREIPKYLETPNGSTKWVDEIALLRKFAK